MTTINTPFSGGCACGAIRYECTAKPVMMFHCHCRDCQHSSGGPFSSFVMVPAEAFKLLQGSLRFHAPPSQRGGKNHRGFCPECGSPILAKPDSAPHIVAIRTASLDDPSWFNPQLDVWTSDAQPWDQMDPALPKFEKYPNENNMRIGVIGAGSMGVILARHLAKCGHHVSIANSRGPESLAALASEIGATPVSVVDAAQAGEIVFIAIPTKAVADLPRALFVNAPSGVVVIDIGNYYPELRDGRIDEIDRGMLDSQWVEQQIGRPVIKAFNNIIAKSLLEKGVPRGTKGRIALPVAGDSLDAKAAVFRLVNDLGFDPIDGGDLDNSWRQQPGTPAYCRDMEAAALRRALAEADRNRIAEYRAEEEARIRRSIAAQTPSGLARQ